MLLVELFVVVVFKSSVWKNVGVTNANDKSGILQTGRYRAL